MFFYYTTSWDPVNWADKRLTSRQKYVYTWVHSEMNNSKVLRTRANVASLQRNYTFFEK